MKRRLPIGIQDFVSIREDGFVYVDKTARIHQMINCSGHAFFLSRPRRFGKSLLCSTLEAVFEGKRDLFGKTAEQPALAIDSLDWEWKKHPVVRIDLNAGVYSNGVSALHSALSRELKREAGNQNVVLDDDDCINQFAQLIEKSCKKNGEKTVVIIDEYDKPLLETMINSSLHIAMRNELKSFYGILKSYDKYLRFVFLTGVSKFSHVSVFSDLNHLTDLTLDPRYADICGITQEEMEENFEPEIGGILNETGRERETYLYDLKRFYDGYRFSEKRLKVYNSFGLLNHFAKGGKFLPYWYDTGTPTFLVNLIIKQKINILDLNNLQVEYESFSKYDVENMEAAPLLYQSGYLTIADYNEQLNLFTLDYPNEEVRSSFSRSLLEQYFQSAGSVSQSLNTRLLTALHKGDIEGVMNALKTFLASVPYDIIEKRENYYQTAIHLIFSMLGFNCRSEVRIAAGRIDTLVEIRDYIYCFEFKLNGTAKEALAQIDTREYLLPWTRSGKTLFKIGVNFDHEKRNIGNWIIA